MKTGIGRRINGYEIRDSENCTRRHRASSSKRATDGSINLCRSMFVRLCCNSYWKWNILSYPLPQTSSLNSRFCSGISFYLFWILYNNPIRSDSHKPVIIKTFEKPSLIDYEMNTKFVILLIIDKTKIPARGPE